MQSSNKEARRAERTREIQGDPRGDQAIAGAALCDEDEVTDPAREIAYLQAAGWRKVAPGESQNPKKRWLDPQTGHADRRILVVPEQRDAAGRLVKEAVYQTVSGVPAWFYSREQAVQVQKDRDEIRKVKA